MESNQQKPAIGINNLDMFVLRISLVVIFFFFGYAKWFDYEAQGLVNFIENSPFLSWMYQVVGIRGGSFILGVAEWLYGLLLLLGFWFCLPGLLGAMGSTITFIMTTTLLFSTPGKFVAEAGGFPALSSTSQFLLKDIVLLAASFVLLRSEITRNRPLLQKIFKRCKKT